MFGIGSPLLPRGPTPPAAGGFKAPIRPRPVPGSGHQGNARASSSSSIQSSGSLLRTTAELLMAGPIPTASGGNATGHALIWRSDSVGSCQRLRRPRSSEQMLDVTIRPSILQVLPTLPALIHGKSTPTTYIPYINPHHHPSMFQFLWFVISLRLDLWFVSFAILHRGHSLAHRFSFSFSISFFHLLSHLFGDGVSPWADLTFVFRQSQLAFARNGRYQRVTVSANYTNVWACGL